LTASEQGAYLEKSEHPSQDRTRKARRWWPILAPLILVVVGASLLVPAGRHQWALSLFRQPTHYTALYFDQAADLPATSVANRPFKVSFSVSNNEGHVVVYHYVLSATSSGIFHVLQESARTVSAGATWTVITVVRPTCRTTPCRIEVSLPGYPETIAFLVKITTPRARHARVTSHDSHGQ
jgi:hypothetical protein